MNECNASLEPSGPIDAPLCVNLPIPVCSYRQYINEQIKIHDANAQYFGGPLGMEEHLAANQGCKVGLATVAAPSRFGGDVFGLEILIIAIAFGVWFVLRCQYTDKEGTSHDTGQAGDQTLNR